ncbi:MULTISPECIES: hypothetical protein [Microbispora]|uniref:Uncharacterized protein n=1 Tax=Microbispora hainanensis TaxID=568844 RepID=A0ABZ1SZZ9_9ACTN|nr:MULTISPECIES: hypothetical protein [Microbispora]NJP23314.1 hypothetical protein [Microbispora sp. CL1-1]
MASEVREAAGHAAGEVTRPLFPETTVRFLRRRWPSPAVTRYADAE